MRQRANAREGDRGAGLVVTAAGLLLVWLWLARGSPAWQGAGVALFLWGHALVLGVEFALMARVNRADPAPSATVGEWLRAWWTESVTAPRVFSWWQPFRWRVLPDTAVGERTHTGRRAVVLVHGFVCNRGLWMPWLRVLRAVLPAFALPRRLFQVEKLPQNAAGKLDRRALATAFFAETGGWSIIQPTAP